MILRGKLTQDLDYFAVDGSALYDSLNHNCILTSRYVNLSFDPAISADMPIFTLGHR